MNFDLTLNLFGKILINMIKKDLPSKKIKKDLFNEYKNILVKADDIGNKNMLITSYALTAFFIALNRTYKYDPDSNIKIVEEGMKNSKLLKMFLGNAKSYFSEERMIKRRKWAEESKNKKYKNDWVLDFIEKDKDFEFGLDYKECGVCKLCKDENCFELAKYLCKLDFLLVSIIGIKLDRTTTLADGGSKCDFRFKK